MTPLASALAIDDVELRSILETALAQSPGLPVRIARLRRRPSPYRTSAALEEIDVDLIDGSSLPLLFKDLGPDRMHELARRVKPAALCDPRREIEVYRHVLPHGPAGTARCHSAVIDQARGRYWLFLERVRGVELYQVGSPEVWRRAAEWLAAMHAAYADSDVAAGAEEVHALRYDAGYYRSWLERARAAARHPAAAPGAAAQVEILAARHEAVVARLCALPATFIHGEFYASNVLVAGEPPGTRVCPVDWEMAAVGPGLFDLAALVTGWDERERQAMTTAYVSALPPRLRGAAPLDDVLVDLSCCQFQLALQWFGWFGPHPAPPEHKRDWLRDAMAMTERIASRL